MKEYVKSFISYLMNGHPISMRALLYDSAQGYCCIGCLHDIVHSCPPFFDKVILDAVNLMKMVTDIIVFVVRLVIKKSLPERIYWWHISFY
jgi:hypothetical protein